WSFRYKFDTIPIESGGKTYVRLIKAPAEFSEKWIDADKLVRYEDGRVYLSDFNFANDQIIYDFNLVEGDTFNLGNDQILYDLIVEEVDTITLLNGQQAKRWLLHPLNAPSDPSSIIWIEGIGNLNGLLTNFLPWTSDAEWSTVLCVHWHDTLVYDNPDYGTCWLMSTATIEETNEEIVAFPNPASEVLSISGLTEVPEQIRIYDSFGNLMYTGVETQIQLDALPPGYYLAILFLKNRNVKRIRFVKI
ncbi:MAG TPA: T9SS type A sorting domain-containing protein, partial [Saprospiraceae bacterium]